MGLAEANTPFGLADGLEIGALVDRFRRTGRLRIGAFLANPDPLRQHLLQRTDWRQIINSGDKVFELDRATRAAMPQDKVRALDAAVHEGAAQGFQFRFENIRVPDDANARAADPTLLNRLAAWMSNGAVRDLLREICSASAIDFADAQATLFSPGDFLTGHDDAVHGKRRHAAYVLGLTPFWRVEWGGLLLFHDIDGREVRGEVPSFNTLDIFAVPQLHSVSLVAPSASEPRLSVTGWLRSHDE